MKKEFISYEQALALKKLGFNNYCLTCYLNGSLQTDPSEIFWFQHSYRSHSKQEFVSAPTFSQAFRWFREKYKYYGLIEGGYDNGKNIFTYVIWNGFKDNIIDEYYETYEEAELACLNKLIEIVKQ